MIALQSYLNICNPLIMAIVLVNSGHFAGFVLVKPSRSGRYFFIWNLRVKVLILLICSIEINRIYYFHCYCLGSARNNKDSYSSIHHPIHWYVYFPCISCLTRVPALCSHDHLCACSSFPDHRHSTKIRERCLHSAVI